MGCGASSRAKYASETTASSVQDSAREVPRSYRKVSFCCEVDSALLSTTASVSDHTALQELQRVRSQHWEVQEFDSRPASEDPEAAKNLMSPTFTNRNTEDSWDWSNCSSWWGERAQWIQVRANEIFAAYNFFFEHIGLRKGWRTAPFEREEVQAPFRAAAEVVVVVRAKLDAERGGMLVLRQVEAMC
mmetsp:Transcript_2008/g.4458  ORF Transcript_2008/g.4458 Transcript_2008/m.4458 type:complete len:188 (-) Transcript_2008:178-741(-)